MYDFLLVSSCNYIPILHRFRNKLKHYRLFPKISRGHVTPRPRPLGVGGHRKTANLIWSKFFCIHVYKIWRL